MSKTFIAFSFAVCMLLSGCGSMSFGETLLETISVFGEAAAIQECYDNGGTREYCEGWH